MTLNFNYTQWVATAVHIIFATPPLIDRRDQHECESDIQLNS